MLLDYICVHVVEKPRGLRIHAAELGLVRAASSCEPRAAALSLGLLVDRAVARLHP